MNSVNILDENSNLIPEGLYIELMNAMKVDFEHNQEVIQYQELLNEYIAFKKEEQKKVDELEDRFKNLITRANFTHDTLKQVRKELNESNEKLIDKDNELKELKKFVEYRLSSLFVNFIVILFIFVNFIFILFIFKKY